MINRPLDTELTFVGFGPANIILIIHTLALGISPKQITVVGDQKGGAFTHELSAGSSVPGNTRSDAYKKMYNDLYQLLPTLRPAKEIKFALDAEKDETSCSLDIASDPLRHIADKISQMVNYAEGRATKIKKISAGYGVQIKLTNGSTKTIHTHQVILGIGGKPRIGKLPADYKHIQLLNPNDVFITSIIQNKFAKQTLRCAVIGSSHSAALVVWNLLEAGHNVVHIANKDYLYAETIIKPDGSKITKHDDTGLKGDVAHWTRVFLKDFANNSSPYQQKYQRYIANDRNEVDQLLQKHLQDCTHAVFTIGYDPAQTVEVEGFILSRENHDNKTMQFHHMPGLWGNGLAFAEMVNHAQSNGLTKYHATAAKLAPRLISFANQNKMINQLGIFSLGVKPAISNSFREITQLRSAL